MSKDSPKKVADALRLAADIIERLSEEQFMQYIGSKRVQVDSKRDKEQPLPKSPSPAKPISQTDVDRVCHELVSLNTREDGNAFLIRAAANRRTLEAVARNLQLPVQRDDSVERLRSKIVENTIGSRLRSSAIQGEGD